MFTFPNLINSYFFRKQPGILFLVCLPILLIALNISLDLLETIFNQSAFYFFESLLFSYFWLLLPPLLLLQIRMLRKQNSIIRSVAWSALLAILHLISYPALVWLVSKLFYSHTFDYYQTLQFGLTAHCFKILLFYSLTPVFRWYHQPSVQKQPATEIAREKAIPSNFPASLLISEGSQQKVVVSLNEVRYFTANPPYVNIFCGQKKYLYQETLKSLLTQLDPERFVRIHRSCIVNVSFARTYKSRLNGDYDVTLTDGTMLRVSRNYAAAFKSTLAATHRPG